MPIYEFACQACGHLFETIVQSSTVPECPACASQKLQKQLSVFAVGKNTGSAPVECGQGACGACPAAAPQGGCALE